MPRREIDRAIEQRRRRRERLRPADAPQDRHRIRFAAEKREIELEVVARPRAVGVNDAEPRAVAAEAPPRIGADGVENRRAPGGVKRLIPSDDRDRYQWKAAPGRFKTRVVVAIDAAADA